MKIYHVLDYLNKLGECHLVFQIQGRLGERGGLGRERKPAPRDLKTRDFKMAARYANKTVMYGSPSNNVSITGVSITFGRNRLFNLGQGECIIKRSCIKFPNFDVDYQMF